MTDQYQWGWRQTLSWKVGFRRGKAGRAYSCPRWADERVYGLAFLQGKSVEPSPPDDKPPLRSKAFQRAMGVVFFLGTAGALVGLIYLLSFLGD
jgi:hypothetical protein